MSLSELITATDLKQWADTNSCRLYLPLLIRKLIRATVPSVESLSIPCGDSTHLPGWDGIVMSQSNIHNVPKGKSVWEFGCDKDYKQKAKGDLLKRTEDSRGEEIKEITFVFVTHDQEEALTMSDKIIVMKDGVITDETRINGALPTIKYLMEK